jgi:hypothetical protein
MKFKSDIEVQSGLKDSSGSTGSSGQVLSSNGSTVSWVAAGSSIANDVQNTVKAGVAINKGQAVYVTGADGTNIIVGLASNTSEATSSKTLGLLNATVAINGFADVVQIGKLAGLNTIGAAEGDPVWLGVGGELIYGLINKPYAPKHLVFLGIVTRVNANNGEIFITVQNGFELNEIHDVDLKTTVPINGHILGYNGTLWVNKTIAGWLGYTPADDANVVHLTGTETITGAKTFTLDTVVNGVNIGKGGGSMSTNTRVGGNALQNNTTGSNNLAVGVNSLRLNITGSQNSALGLNSLYSNTAGNSNSAVGLGSLLFNTTGSQNSALGVNSLYFNETGSNNSAFGMSSLTYNTTGSGNLAVGYVSMLNNTTGNNNSAFGNASLYSNTTGSQNLALGLDSGRLISNKSTSATILNNSIMIGYRTSPLANDQTNQIVIGHDASGLGNNTSVLGNSSTIQTWLGGKVTIGTTVNNGIDQLQVSGYTLSTGYKIPSGLSTQYLMADGSVTTGGAGISGSGTSGRIPKFTGTTSIGDSLISDNGTGIGIGTANATSLLNLQHAIAPQIDFHTGAIKRADIRASSGSLFLNSLTGNDIQLQTDGATKLTIASSGNVGIGTSSPSAKLEVAGNVKITGIISTTSTDTNTAIFARNDGNTAGWRGRISSVNATADRSSFVATYGGNAVVGAHNNAFNAWADLYVNTVDGVSGGAVRLPGSVLISGNQVLHAGNYNSYTPTLTGTGASGTWGIAISGNAAWSTDAGSVDGIDSSRIVYGSNASKIGSHSNANDWRDSGFYENEGGGSNWPSTTWYNSINVRHSNQTNYHGFQVAMSYYDNDFWFRSYNGSGNFRSWAKALSTANYTSYTLPLSGGTLTGALTATAFYQSSDITLKNIISQDGDTIKFTWKDKRDEKIHIGYIAQEVQKTMPDQVQADDKGLLSVNYIEVLVQKIQDLENRIKQLEK